MWMLLTSSRSIEYMNLGSHASQMRVCEHRKGCRYLPLQKSTQPRVSIVCNSSGFSTHLPGQRPWIVHESCGSTWP